MWMNKNFLQTKGTNFVYGDEIIRLRGFGIGSWLNLEPFMIGIPTIEGMIQRRFANEFGKANADRFFECYYESFFSVQDAKFLKRIGVNFIRVPFNYHLFIDDQNPEVYRTLGFKLLDRLLNICEEHEIFVMLDLHAAPGGQNPDWHSESMDGRATFWLYKVFRDQAVQLWKTLAERYKDKSYLAGYDLLNEPFIMNGDVSLLNQYYNESIRAIRSVDINHIIYIEGDFFAMDFSQVDVIEDPHLAISFHYYPAVWYPEFLSSKSSDQQNLQILRDGLTRIRSTIHFNNQPLICGEAGYEISKLGMNKAMKITAETIQLFEENNISWCLWSYKDTGIMGLIQLHPNSSWMKFSDKISEKWNHHKMTDYSYKYLSSLSAGFPENIMEEYDVNNNEQNNFSYLENQPDANARDNLEYRLHFRHRSILYDLEDHLILKPILLSYKWEDLAKLPESFKYSECIVRKPFADLIAEICQ